MKKWLPAPASLPEGLRVYAVGDIHGCSGPLAALLRAIVEDLAADPPRSAQVIHIGDCIDRGPDTAGVIETLMRPFPSVPCPVRVVTLLGNHEDMALAALADPEMADIWLLNGGDASLASWGVSPAAHPSAWESAIPRAHLAFLHRLPLMHTAGGYLFVHAGLRPGVPLAEQSREGLLWIRKPFLSFEGVLPAVVVHGHTPAREPQARSNRIGIDTGACRGGPLTAVVPQANRLRFLQR